MKNKLNVDILFYAFRYALGRKTYAVREVVSELKENWKKFGLGIQIQIQEEIEEALKDNRAGMDCDILKWNEILELENNKPQKPITSKQIIKNFKNSNKKFNGSLSKSK